jgi:hypothetical protein
METITKENTANSRLAQLETESRQIIDSYLQQVSVDANSAILKNLQSKLKEVRAQQWQLFNKISPMLANSTRLSNAA